MAFTTPTALPLAPRPAPALASPRRRPRVSRTRISASAPPPERPDSPVAGETPQPSEPSSPPSSELPPPSTPLSRRAFLTSSTALLLSATALSRPDDVSGLGLAPTPINPYARRRSERLYQGYVKAIEDTIENAPVANFKKVVEAGGAGLGVSYRIAGFAAFVASACSTAIVHPIDSIKTRLQARGTPAMIKDERGLFDNLYTGIVSNILKEAPNSAIYLAVYELIKGFLMNLSVTSFFHDLPLLTFMVAGALGDAIGSLVRVPAEIVNKRLQLGVNDNWRSAARDAFLSPLGRQGSTVAWTAVLWRDVPYGGLQIMMYEFGKQVLLTHPTLLGGLFAQPGVLCDVFMGALAGALAAMITTPADVLVTRLSVQNPQSYLETRSYMGVSSTARRILQDEGIGGFFKGTFQRGVYYAPLIGLFFALYEFNRGWLEHPEALLTTAESVKNYVLAEWHNVPAAFSTAYNKNSPLLTGLVFFFSEYLPLALSCATLRSQV